MSDTSQEHEHQFLAHNHRHYHVTHNWTGGGFEHLSAEHEHEHDHAGMVHEHHPHTDFESEHRDEAHIHDHEHALRRVEPLEPAGAGEKTVTGKKPAKTTAAPKPGTEAGRRVARATGKTKGDESKGETARPARRTTKAR